LRISSTLGAVGLFGLMSLKGILEKRWENKISVAEVNAR
jgi:hypothetical protein